MARWQPVGLIFSDRLNKSLAEVNSDDADDPDYAPGILPPDDASIDSNQSADKKIKNKMKMMMMMMIMLLMQMVLWITMTMPPTTAMTMWATKEQMKLPATQQ